MLNRFFKINSDKEETKEETNFKKINRLFDETKDLINKIENTGDNNTGCFRKLKYEFSEIKDQYQTYIYDLRVENKDNDPNEEKSILKKIKAVKKEFDKYFEGVNPYRMSSM